MSASVLSFNGKSPVLGAEVYIAEGARIIGDLVIGDYSSVWFNTVIRADIMPIRIGSYTNIQDNCTLHITGDNFPLTIGNSVTVGHNAVLHGCTVNDEVLIGMGAIVLDGAVVSSHSLVAAGSVVKPGFVVPEGVMVAGAPAKIIRNLSDDEIKGIINSAKKYSQYAQMFKNEKNA